MPNPIGGQPYQTNYTPAYSSYGSYAAPPSYGGGQSAYGMPPAMGQQTQMMSIFMSLMQTQSSLQQGFSQFLGQGYGTPQPGYGAPTQGYGAPAPSYGAPTPSYGGGGYQGGGYQPAPAYKPAPVFRPAPAPAPAPPAKKGGYA